MISKQRQISLCVIVSVLLAVWMDAVSGMTSIQLIPQYPLIQGSVTLNVTGITGNIGSAIWYKGPSTANIYQILSYFPNDSSPLVRGPLYHDRMTPFSNGSLLISNLIRADEGDYIVKIQTDKPTDISVNLKIYDTVDKPTITNSTSTLKENDPFSLTCTSTNAEGIVWSRVPTTASLSADNKTLSFSRINRLDAGDYSCEASNPVSKKNSDTITITVAYGPENVDIKVERHSVSFVSLKCSATSVPVATYQWKLNGTVIKEQQNPLQINQKDPQNEGTYTCEANNSVTQLTAMKSEYVNATTEPPANTNNDSLDGGNKTMIIGIVVAIILVLALVAAIAYLFVIHRRNKKNLNDKSSTIKKNGQTNPSATASEQPEVQYADIVFNKNMPKRQQPPPETLYANRSEIARPQEVVYSDLRLN